MFDQSFYKGHCYLFTEDSADIFPNPGDGQATDCWIMLIYWSVITSGDLIAWSSEVVSRLGAFLIENCSFYLQGSLLIDAWRAHSRPIDFHHAISTYVIQIKYF